MPDPTRFRSGLLFGLVAYTWWGLIPLYFKQIAGVPPEEILAQRIVWAVGLLAVGVAAFGGWHDLLRVLASRKLVLTLLLSATLLAVNWLLYIRATVNDRVADASLGYYMLPLVNAFLATLFFGEKLRPLHYPALALVALAVLVPAVWIGFVPWLAVTISITFGLYGLVRKMIAVESFTGLTVETLLMLPAAAAYLVWATTSGLLRFGAAATESVLLGLGGVVTVVPLLTFTLAIRRLPLLALNLIQVLSPTMQFGLAVWWNRQPVPPAMWIALGCVWAGVALFITDAVWQASAGRPPVAEAEPAEAALTAPARLG